MKVREIAEFLGGELRGDSDVEITSVADLLTASIGQIAFLSKSDTNVTTNASCVIMKSGEAANFSCSISVSNPKLAFARAAAKIHKSKDRHSEIHKSSVISDSAILGEGIFIGAFVCVGDNSSIGKETQLRAGAKVGDNVTIGSRCILHPNVFVEDGSMIGDDVIIHAGTIIGADGFGYVTDENGEHIKFPQIGTVVIEDNVEIGANSCIDRGALGETRIGEGTKIDNMVQVAHNVQIGKRVLIASQTGISGSTVIEDDCVIGGQVGFGDHVTIKSQNIIGSQAGVLPGKILRKGVWWGTPAQPLADIKRQHAHLKRIEKLKSDIDALKRKKSKE